MNATPIALALVLPLVAWRLYSRLRRMLGRQRLTRRQPWITLVFFPLLVAVLVVAVAAHPVALVGLGSGLATGLGLALYSLRRTVFAVTPDGLFYTPSAHVGGVLAVLLGVRVLYRAIQLYATDAATLAATPLNQQLSPLTLAVLGAVAGYHVVYAAGLLRWRAGRQCE